MAKKSSNNAVTLSAEEMAKTVGKGLSFGASEAYKLLRANLDFSFPDSSKSKVIGVTSSLRGEAKSTTSINLAYTIAENGKRVLLIEGDMRLPVVAKRLRLMKSPGLSDLLAGHSSGNEVLQNSGLLNNLKIITSAVSLGHDESLIVFMGENDERQYLYPEEFHNGFFRFSVGIEDSTDLIADLAQALQKAGLEVTE